MAELELIAATTVGLEAVVRRELEALGYAARVDRVGWVAFAGDESAICRANLWLRAADRVLLRVGTFEARDFGELFDRTRELPWERWIAPEAAFPVRGRSAQSQLSSVPACQSIVKKAIVERLLAAHGVASLPETGAGCTVEVALLKDAATLMIDTTGPSLHKRGYRTLVGEAPLKETLAAAMVMLSFWRPDRPLIDPFCGSGTIPIEAALIGRNLAPGLERRFAAEDWPALSAAPWRAAREEARALARPDIPARIAGTDIDAEALSLARYHARRAGVEGQIHFQQRPFAELSSKQEYGCVICNPPYGERMSDRREVEALYRTIPLILRRLPTWSHYFLSARKDFERLVGQPADRRRKLYNGRIECTYYQFHGPRRPRGGERAEPEGEAPAAPPAAPPPAVPAFGGLSDHAGQQTEMFANRLRKRARYLRKWPGRGISCYRLYDRDVPEVPLTVDLYEARLHVVEHDRPHDRTAAQHADWLDLMARTAGEALGIAAGEVFLIALHRDRPTERQAVFTVAEGGLKFRVDLAAAEAGLPLDHRITRSMVREQSPGLRVLDLFAGTGTFGVCAAAGRARAVTLVEASEANLAWAREDFALNGLGGGEHRFVHGDAMVFLRQCAAAPLWDLAIVDLPAAPTARHARPDHDQPDLVELLRLLAERMPAGGVIYLTTRDRRLKLPEPPLPTWDVRDITRQTIPPDFRNLRIHRTWRLIRQPGPR